MIILELFAVMSWECPHYTPEPRLKTEDQENRIRAIILKTQMTTLKNTEMINGYTQVWTKNL